LAHQAGAIVVFIFAVMALRRAVVQAY